MTTVGIVGTEHAAMAEEIELKTRYLRLAARAWGPQDGLPVMALHGWLDNAASFDHLAPLLPKLRLIALDLPGHGLSEHRPAGIHYHFVDFIPDVFAAADALGWNRFALLGHSLGAGIASVAAGVVTERISRLALIEGLGPLTGNPAEGPVVLAKAMEQMKRLDRKRLPVYYSLEEAIQARRDAGDLSHQAAMTLAARGTKPAGLGIGWRSDPRLIFRSPLYLMEEQVLAYLAAIKAPTLLIRGEQGYLRQRKFMEKRHAQVAQLRIQDLPGGHHLHLEQPEPVAQVLAKFFDDADG